MKRKICLLLSFTFIINFSYAQIVRCATYELHKKRIETDPQYRAYYENIKQKMVAWSGAKTVARNASKSITTIPVVVHVVYNTSDQNIPDAQILSQISVLNQDYTATNANIVDVPSGFKSRIGNPYLNFCLATIDPNGNYTTGIERQYTTTTSFGWEDETVKFTANGGLDAWDNTKYLNIWVCNLNSNLLGYTQMPNEGPASTDGCVVMYTAFGNTGNTYPVYSAYNIGRTATHEIGHWLGLIHVWGDDYGACSGSDYVMDTPDQADATYGCPSSPDIDACSSLSDTDVTGCHGDPVNGILFEDYMDYTDDRCMEMFTAGQVVVMDSILTTVRPTILTSNGCTLPNGIAKINAATFIDVYPNPANDIIHIDSHLSAATVLSITAYDMLGNKITSSEIYKTGEQKMTLDVSSLSAGLYTLVVSTDQGNIAKRFAITR